MKTRESAPTRYAVKTATALGLAIMLVGMTAPAARAQDLDLRLIGSWPVPTSGSETDSAAVNDLALSGNHAYLACQGDVAAGLQVIDVSDPQKPVRVGQCEIVGGITGVAVSGRHACVTVTGLGMRLELIDISDPASPVRVGSYGLDIEHLNGFALSDHHAFVAADYEHLMVIDVGNPSNPGLTAVHDITGGVEGFAVSGKYAYVIVGDGQWTAGDEEDPLIVLDMSDPVHPVKVGAYINGHIHGVAVVGNRACVARSNDEAGWISVLDVTDPTNPLELGSCRLGWMGLGGMAIEGNHVYVPSYFTGFSVIDICDPAGPRRVGAHHLGGTRAVAGSGHFAYVAALGGLQVIDAGNPANPGRVGSFDTWRPETGGGRATAVEVSDNHAFVSDEGWGLHILDISDPANPVRVGGYPYAVNSSPMLGVAVSGSHAYFAQAGLQVFDISDFTNPIQISGYSLGGTAYGVAITGNHAYLAASDGLHVFDVSDPQQPLRVGGYDMGAGALAVHLSGAYAYVADPGAGLQVIDVTDPTHPVRVGGYSSEAQVTDLTVAGNHAYLAGGEGLVVLDISDPSNLTLVGACETIKGAYHVIVDEDFAYVAAENGLHVIDFSDPANPHRVGGNTAFSAEDVAVYGDNVFVAGGASGLIILNKFTELRFGPASVEADGMIRLPVDGASGQRVKLQRSSNLVDWEDWTTMTLGGKATGCGLIDTTTTARQRFYRVVEDGPTLTDEP